MPQNSDVYIETIVARQRPPFLTGIRLMAYLLTLLFGVMAMMALPAILSAPKGVLTVVVLACGFGFLSWYYTLYGRIDYEYCLTNDALDIYVILNLQKRKRVTALSVRDVLVCAPAGSDSLQGYGHASMKTYDAASHRNGVRYYTLIYRAGGGTSGTRRLYFEPDEKLLLAMKQRNKAAVFDMD